MTFRASLSLALASAALLAACGGRSQLRDSSAEGAGSGGSTGSGGDGGSGPGPSSASVSSGGGAGPGGAGGSGGSTSLCVVDGKPIGLAGTEGYNLVNPALVDPGTAGLTTLIAGWNADKGSPMTPTELRHSSFDAWGPWPANGTIGPSYLADYVGGERFTAAPAIGGFSLFFATPSPSAHLTFLSPLVPDSGKIPGSFQLGAAMAEPLFVAQSAQPSVHLMGFAGSVVVPHDFNLIHVTDTSSSPLVTFGLGCASESIVAAGAPALGGFLVAFSTGTDFDDPSCHNGGVMKPATRVQLALVSDDGPSKPIASIENGLEEGSIAAIQVVPSGEGAWVSWTHKNGNSSRIQAVRIDPTGTLSGPLEVPFSSDPTSISAAHLGDRLALAWTAIAPDGQPLLQVSVLDTAGTVTHADITLDSLGSGRTALLGSPSGDSLLVAWVEAVSSSRKLRLARLACSLP